MRETSPYQRCCCHAFLVWIFYDVREYIPVLSHLYRAYYGGRWIYSSMLAYIVDANVGRSSTAAATNSAFRGIAAFVGAEVAIPLQVSRAFGPLPSCFMIG